MPNEETDNGQILVQQEVVPTIPTQGDEQADYFSGDAWKRATGSPEEIQAVIAGLKKLGVSAYPPEKVYSKGERADCVLLIEGLRHNPFYSNLL